MGSITKNSYLALFFLLPFFQSMAQETVSLASAQSAGMGGAMVSIPGKWALLQNQAGIAHEKSLSFGLCYQNRFAIKELGLKSVTAILPVWGGVFGSSYSRFGFSAYNESKLGLAFAKKLGDNISAAIQLDYFQTRFNEQYGKKGIMTGEIGLQANPTENFQFGAHLFNPVSSQNKEVVEDELPQILAFGLSYNFAKLFLVSLEAENTTDQGMVLKVGCHWLVKDVFVLRGGFSTNPRLISFGAGFLLKHFTADLAFSQHPILGYSSNVAIAYQFNK